MSSAADIISRYRGAYAAAYALDEPIIQDISGGFYSINGKGAFTVSQLESMAGDLEDSIEQIEVAEAQASQKPSQDNNGSADIPDYDPELVRLMLETMPGDMARRWQALERAAQGIGTEAIERLGEQGLTLMLSMVASLTAEYDRVAEDDPSAFLANTAEEIAILKHVISQGKGIKS